jgi:hypothetical protein
MDRGDVARWINGYERAWRSPGTDQLQELFTPSATYLTSPWATPHGGLDAIAQLWDAERDGPDEPFTMENEIVAVDDSDRAAVVRVAVEYLKPGGRRWRDLWIIRFAEDGRCEAFEEWPFAAE